MRILVIYLALNEKLTFFIPGDLVFNIVMGILVILYSYILFKSLDIY